MASRLLTVATSPSIEVSAIINLIQTQQNEIRELRKDKDVLLNENTKLKEGQSYAVIENNQLKALVESLNSKGYS